MLPPNIEITAGQCPGRAKLNDIVGLTFLHFSFVCSIKVLCFACLPLHHILHY